MRLVKRASAQEDEHEGKEKNLREQTKGKNLQFINFQFKFTLFHAHRKNSRFCHGDIDRMIMEER